MLTAKSIPCVRPLLVAVLVLGLPSCIIEGKIGDDPGDEDDGSHEGSASGSAEPETTTSTSGGAGHSSAALTTSGAVSDTAGEDVGTVGVGPDCGSVPTELALDACGVVLVPPEPDEPVYYAGVECEGGVNVDVVSSQDPMLYAYGDCLCAVLDCGQPVGGSTGSPTAGGWEETDTGEPPDACGPYPPGDDQLICSCETCSVVRTNLDPDWLANEADTYEVCDCLCGAAGCGAPI